MGFIRTTAVAWCLALVAAVSPARAAGGPLENEARGAGAPLVVRFGLDRCQQCIEQGRVFEALAPRYQGRVRFRFVHIDREDDLAARYRVLLIPTVILFDAQGRQVYRHVGLVEEQDLDARIREVLGAGEGPRGDGEGPS